jgi:hypothetical protein
MLPGSRTESYGIGSILYQCELLKGSSMSRLYRVNISVSIHDRSMFGKGGVEL